MWHNTGRRIILHPNVCIALIEAREHQSEMEALRAEVAELREVLEVVVRATREQAEADLHELRRQLQAALARLQRRDLTKPLH